MKKYSILVLIVVSCVVNITSQKLISKSKWKQDNLIIDGKTSEWERPLNFYNYKSGLMYSISNDSSNLYFCFLVYDQTRLENVVNAGWSLELSSKNRKNKFKASIIFPPVQTETKFDVSSKKQNYINDQNFVRNDKYNYALENLTISYKLQLININSIGFKNNESEIPFLKIKGNKIDIGIDSLKNFAYEIAIPIENLFKKPTIRLDEELILKVGINGLKSKDNKSSQEKMEENKTVTTQNTQNHMQRPGKYVTHKRHTVNGNNILYQGFSFKRKFVLTQKN